MQTFGSVDMGVHSGEGKKTPKNWRCGDRRAKVRILLAGVDKMRDEGEGETHLKAHGVKPPTCIISVPFVWL